MNSTIKTLAIALAMGLSAAGVFAAATASDTAANYTSTWGTSPPNLGSGFGAWDIQTLNNTSPPYVGTYLDLASYGNADGALSPSGSGGAAWGTYANGGSGNGEFIMTRPFTAGPSGSTSLYNQTFSIGIGSGGVGGTGSSISLNVGTAFGLSYVGGGSDNMLLSVDGGTATAVPVNFADLGAGLLVSLAVSGPLSSTSEGYALTISPFAGGSPIYSTSGTFNSAVYNTSSFTFDDLNTSANGYVNNPSITPESVPEPTSMVMLGFAGLASLLAIRRRK
ncbi:MAG TPA: PEP-CTERM sorting domain-containing protein [Candidatus Saccharimonadales bacterium]|nr:PEP-CTERM sorting domain-containing protein [Candidatus Saccharimonadales bacterium]